MPESITRPTGRLVALDFIRCFAILAIVNSHFELLTGHNHVFFTGGTFGNNLFFFISGLGLMLSKREVTAKEWLLRRAIRILPVYYIGIILIFGFAAMGWLIPAKPVAFGRDFLLHLCFLQHLVDFQLLWFIQFIVLMYLILWLLKFFLFPGRSYLLFPLALAFYAMAVAFNFEQATSDHSLWFLHDNFIFKFAFYLVPFSFGIFVGSRDFSGITSGKPWLIALFLIFFFLAAYLQVRPHGLQSILPILACAYLFCFIAVCGFIEKLKIEPLEKILIWIALGSYQLLIAHSFVNKMILPYASDYHEGLVIAVGCGLYGLLTWLLYKVDKAIQQRAKSKLLKRREALG